MTLRALLAFGLALTLSACWGSSGPLMPAAAVKPAPLSGTWVKQGTDVPGDQATYRVRLAGKVAQLEKAGKNGWDASFALSFDPLGKNLYLVQAVSPGSANPNYVVMLVPPKAKQLQVINPACTAEQAANWGAARSGGDCSWPDYATLRKAAIQVAQAALEKPAPGLEVASIEYYDRQN